MPPKTIKSALAYTLENLSAENFEKFRDALLDRREEPRVRTRQVEGKNYRQIADLLVSVHTEAEAHVVAVELLKEINCGRDADELEKVIAGLSSNPGSSGAAKPSTGASGDAMAEDKHFVDKHKLKLIDRVNNIEPILDELLEENVISQEQYSKIRALPVSQEKMRELYSGCLRSSPACKEIFYESLKKNEKFLVRDLEGKS